MEWGQAIVLAIVQGITEFFPVSSSAHLILVPELLGWPDQGLDFDLGVHAGSLIAVIIWFRRELLTMWADTRSALRHPSTLTQNLAGKIIVATIPVLIIGFLFNDIIEQHLRAPLVIATTTAIFGLVLWLSATKNGQRSLDNMRVSDAIIIGFAQVLALIPGTSRSGITMSAASFLGFRLDDSARFSFLLAIPTIGIASLYLAYKIMADGTPVGWQWVLIGAALSAIAAWIGIGFCLAVLKRLGYGPFVIYRLCLAAILFAVFI